MNEPTHLESEVETRGIKKADLLDLTTGESQMRDAIKKYRQFMADKPSVTDIAAQVQGSGASGQDIQRGVMAGITKWNARGAAVGQELEDKAKMLQAKLMETVRQSNRDKELASMNVHGLQKLIQKLNVERDQLMESVGELNTAQGIDDSLKVEYRSQHVQYIVFFIVMLIVVGLLFRIQTSQESGSVELLVLIASILFIVYHFSNWIMATADDFWDWLNGLFNF